jgi:hypothetical protein
MDFRPNGTSNKDLTRQFSSSKIRMQFLENVLLESNYHKQDNAVIVITKATSVLHLINLKKKLFYTKITEEKYELNFKSNDIKNLKTGFIYDVGFVIAVRR